MIAAPITVQMTAETVAVGRIRNGKKRVGQDQPGVSHLFQTVSSG